MDQLSIYPSRFVLTFHFMYVPVVYAYHWIFKINVFNSFLIIFYLKYCIIFTFVNLFLAS